nr:NAD-dependent epimerase/dehydratase family protein [uncultured Carboxylicivirga sp.]
MKVIVIGAKGFIGQHLIKFLNEQGHEVWGADVVVDYAASGKYFLIDASNSDFQNVFHFENYDLCVNCSGAASVPDSITNPMRDYYLNTVNVFNILSAIQRYQPKCKFINLGSAAVYGNPQYLPVSEKAIVQPLSPYGFHKYQAEQICEEFYRFFGLNTCSLRIFSVYGAGLKKQLFWDTYKKTLQDGTIQFFGTGDESRDFIHVNDLSRAIELIALNSQFKADIINVANGEEVSIKNAISTFLSCFDRAIDYKFSGEVRKGDPLNWRADIGKLEALGYKQSKDLLTGLKEYYQWITSLSEE